jgi:altronate dehydratase small subunit
VARPVSGGAPSDPRLLMLADGDNVLIVIATIGAGERFQVEGVTVETPVVLPLGFKVAATDLDEGIEAIRYGMPIGRTTRAVARGELVHTHNLASTYMRTHARGEA